MPLTIEASVNELGQVTLLEPVTLRTSRRALVTILEKPPQGSDVLTLLSEAALAVDWNRPEEDAAWSHLQ